MNENQANLTEQLARLFRTMHCTYEVRVHSELGAKWGIPGGTQGKHKQKGIAHAGQAE